MFRFFAIFIALSHLVISPLASAAEDPWVILQKTAFAARELNYKGIFVYQNRLDTRSVEIHHMNNGGRELTRNVVLAGQQPRQVFSEGADIVIFSPKNDKVHIEKRRGQNLFPAMLPTDLTLIKHNYTAKLGTTEIIAGRATQIVELLPNDAFRYSYKIWADIEFGLMAKVAMVDQKNEVLEQIWFNDLNMMNNQDLNWFQPKIDLTKKYVMEEETAKHSDKTAAQQQWEVADLPPGYRKIDQIERVVAGKPHLVNQLIFSDGIASVSLFIEPVAKGARPKIGHTNVGNTNMCAHVVDGYQVTVVGEVPAATVQQISKSVTFKK